MANEPADLLQRAVERAVTRRQFLSAVIASLPAASCVHPRSRGGTVIEFVDLAGFMRMSQVLTGVPNLGDDELGREYLAALLADPTRAEQLAALWRTAGFGGVRPPVSAVELATRGCRGCRATALADTISAYWYTGVYDGPAGTPTVATYVDALAWRTLGYRDGPSACGGVFGHWADEPSV